MVLSALDGGPLEEHELGKALHYLHNHRGDIVDRVLLDPANVDLATGLPSAEIDLFRDALTAQAASDDPNASQAQVTLHLVNSSVEELTGLGDELPAQIATLPPAMRGHLFAGTGDDPRRRQLLIQAMAVGAPQAWPRRCSRSGPAPSPRDSAAPTTIVGPLNRCPRLRGVEGIGASRRWRA